MAAVSGQKNWFKKTMCMGRSQSTKIKLCLGKAFVCSYWGAGDGLGAGWNCSFWGELMLPNVLGDTNV